MITKGSFAKRLKGHHDLNTMRDVLTPLDLGRIRPANRGQSELPPQVNRKEIERYVTEEKRRFAKHNQILKGTWERIAAKVLKNQAILAVRYQLQKTEHGAFGIGESQPADGKPKPSAKAKKYRTIQVSY